MSHGHRRGRRSRQKTASHDGQLGDDVLQRLVGRMRETMEKTHNAVGLAAPQVGLPLRLAEPATSDALTRRDGASWGRHAGLGARIVQHETDHLDWVLYLARAELRSLLTMEQVVKRWGPARTAATAEQLGFSLP
ncbi:peptide deformylase [Streptomyces hygroscopicus subsp. limoneus]|nr:peptide deformylase [Streptomyces hygroscopicus subsp. limoneus]